jgi:hypothetical protein
MTANKIRGSWDQRLFSILWFWVSLRTLIPWLVFFRLTFEGDSYRWGTTYFGRSFHSSGFARADFLLIYFLLAIGIFILYQLRQYNFRIAAPVLVAFLGVLGADALFDLVGGDPIIFQGDTLGIKIDVSVLFFTLQFGMFGLAVAWWVGVRAGAVQPNSVPLSKLRKNLAWLCAGIVPLQLYLLVSDEPHGMSDQIGVIMTLAQGALLAFAFYPGSGYRGDPDQLPK